MAGHDTIEAGFSFAKRRDNSVEASLPGDYFSVSTAFGIVQIKTMDAMAKPAVTSQTF